MKSLKLALLALLAVGLFGLASCEKFNNPVDDGDDVIETGSYVFTSYDVTDYEMTDASLESDFVFVPILDDNESLLREPKKDINPKRPRTPFDQIFRQMGLDSTQMVAMKEYFDAHRDCVKGWLEMLRESQMEILQAAREDVKAIRDAYKAGEMTREEAVAAIKAINLATREALRNNPMNELVRAGLIDCNEELMANIKSELTPEQLIMFERWLASKNIGSNTGTTKP